MVNRKRSKRRRSRNKNKVGAGWRDRLLNAAKKAKERLENDPDAMREMTEGAIAAGKALNPDMAGNFQNFSSMIPQNAGKRKTKISSLKAKQIVSNFFGSKLKGGKKKNSKKKNSRKKNSRKKNSRKWSRSKRRRKQKGGEKSVFDGNMNNRTFGCRQPYWKPKCV